MTGQTGGTATSIAEDRNRQLAAAAWILGWIGGPLPAIAILLVTRPSGWTHRLVVSAAVFWVLMWGVFYTLIYFGASYDITRYWLWWLLAIAVGMGGTIAGAWSAARMSSRASDQREPW